MRLILAALLLVGGRARAQEPAYDALAALFARETLQDATAAAAIPERGEKLARLSADLTLAAQGLEAFRSPEDAERALKLALERVPPELRSRFSSRRQALDTLYRTLAVTDYTWAARVPGENCSALDWRARLLASPDGLFKDPKTGEASTWVVHLLGPDALKGVEKALDNASSGETAKGRAYELLRAKAAKATAALEAAPEDKRAWLHCLRGEAYENLARANQAGEGPIAASRGTIPSRGVALIGRMVNGVFEAHGAGVLITTKAGARILTDAKVVGDGDGYQAAFPDKGTPIPVTIERMGETLAVLSSPQDLGEGRELANADPAKDDLVTVVSHSERLGAWAWTQGLVSEAQDGAFQTDAVVDAAQAGGAVLDENGRVAGLLTLRNAEAEDGEGEWPVGMPASAIKSWLDGGELQTAGLPIRLQDAGTSSIISASVIYSQTKWGAVRGACVANCGGGSAPPSSRSYSGPSGAEMLGRQMGEAIGQGARALFRGLGSMFRSKGQGFKPRPSSPGRKAVVKTDSPRPVEAPKSSPPPKPPLVPSALSLQASADLVARGEEFSITARLDFTGIEGPRSGHALTLNVGASGLDCGAWTRKSDSSGLARWDCVRPLDERELPFDSLDDEMRRRGDRKRPGRVTALSPKADKITRFKRSVEGRMDVLDAESEKHPEAGNGPIHDDTPGLEPPKPAEGGEEIVIKGDRVTLGVIGPKGLSRDAVVVILESPCSGSGDWSLSSRAEGEYACRKRLSTGPPNSDTFFTETPPDAPSEGDNVDALPSPRTPAKGEPGKTVSFPDGRGGRTDRTYGEDGRAIKDVDYGHDHGSGDPHVHDWDWSKDKPRRPARASTPGETQ